MRRRKIAENFTARVGRTKYERYRRQMTDGWATTYSEREREFTFAKIVGQDNITVFIGTAFIQSSHGNYTAERHSINRLSAQRVIYIAGVKHRI